MKSVRNIKKQGRLSPGIKLQESVERLPKVGLALKMGGTCRNNWQIKIECNLECKILQNACIVVCFLVYMCVCLNMQLEQFIQLVKQDSAQVSHICGIFLCVFGTPGKSLDVM